MLTKIATFALVLATSLTAGTAGTAAAGRFAQPPPSAAPSEPPAVDTAPDTAPAIDSELPELPSRDAVKAALAKRRAHNLASFHAYWTGGTYPHNTYRMGPLNVWRDESGHFCAAATMIDKDGQHALAEKTAEENNNLRLLDVTKGPLLDWMLTSGLTIEDIDRIQAPAVEPERMDAQTLAIEDARLKKGYIATEAYLKKHTAEDLEIATTRLMRAPELAWALVRG